MFRRLVIGIFIASALLLNLAACSNQQPGGTAGAETPTATTYSTPSDTPTPMDTSTPEPTATPAPPGKLPAGTPVVLTDIQGFRFSIQEQTVSFSPTYVDDSGNSHTAPPGYDMLVLHFIVRNLLTDRPGILDGADRDAIGIYGPCFDSTAPQAPNGQCMQNQNWVLWIGSVPSINYFEIPVGGNAQFDYATQYRESTNITAMTMWLNTCKGDGDFWHCSLTDSAIPLAGGVLLSAPTNT